LRIDKFREMHVLAAYDPAVPVLCQGGYADMQLAPGRQEALEVCSGPLLDLGVHLPEIYSRGSIETRNTALKVSAGWALALLFTSACRILTIEAPAGTTHTNSLPLLGRRR